MHAKVAKMFLMLVLMSAAGTALSACHTIQGVGEDIQDTGRTIQNAL